MKTIKGGIKFITGGQIPEKMKNFIKEEGIKIPFQADGLKYSNNKIDNWFRIKANSKKYKYNRTSEKFVDDKNSEVLIK